MSKYYRVRYPELSRFLGLGPSDVTTRGTTRGYPIPVLEPDSECFRDPRTAAEVALQAGILPFTIEEAK